MNNIKENIKIIYHKVHEMNYPIYIRLSLSTSNSNETVEQKVKRYLDELFDKLSRYGRSEAIYPEIVCLYKKYSYEDGEDVSVSLFIDARDVYKDTKIENNSSLFQILHDLWLDIDQHGDTFISFYKEADDVRTSIDERTMNNVNVRHRRYKSDNINYNHNGMLSYLDVIIKDLGEEMHTYMHENLLYRRTEKRILKR